METEGSEVNLQMEKRKNENVCKTCKYYIKCDKPERPIKCMGYAENGGKSGQHGQRDSN